MNKYDKLSLSQMSGVNFVFMDIFWLVNKMQYIEISFTPQSGPGVKYVDSLSLILMTSRRSEVSVELLDILYLII